MGKLVDFNSYPRPLNLDGRKERLAQREKELREEFERLKLKSKEVFKDRN